MNTYNLNHPMSWTEFKELPDDLKRQYLANLQTRFNVPLPKISTDMFRMGHTSLNMYCRRHKIHSINMRGKTMNFEDNKRWLDWLNDAALVTAEAPVDDILVDEASIEEPAVEAETLPEMTVETDVPGDEIREYLDRVLPLIEEACREEAMEEITPAVEVTDENDFEMTDMAATFKGEYSTEKFLHWMSRLPLVEGRRVKIFMEIETL